MAEPAIIPISVFLSRIRFQNADAPTPEESAVRARFLEKWPGLEEKVITYQANPACKCAGEMQAELSKDTALDDKASYVFGAPIKLSIPRSVAGETFMIQDTQEAYRAFIQNSLRAGYQYRGLQIIKDGFNLKIYYY